MLPGMVDMRAAPCRLAGLMPVFSETNTHSGSHSGHHTRVKGVGCWNAINLSDPKASPHVSATIFFLVCGGYCKATWRNGVGARHFSSDGSDQRRHYVVL